MSKINVNNKIIKFQTTFIFNAHQHKDMRFFDALLVGDAVASSKLFLRLKISATKALWSQNEYYGI